MTELEQIAVTIMVASIFAYILLRNAASDLIWARLIEEDVKKKNARRRFGDIRNRLMLLVATDVIKPTSSTFFISYRICTIVMRRMDEHQELSRAMIEGIERSLDSGGGRMASESHSWNEETVHLILELAQEIDNLILEYSTPFRISWWLLSKINGRKLTVREAIEKIRHSDAEREKDRKAREEAREHARRMREIANSSHPITA